MIQIEVEGRAAPKGSRIQCRSKDGTKAWTRPASKYEKPWIDTIKQATQIVMRHHPQPEPPYAVDLYFYIERPKTKNARYPYPTKADIDKLARAALDGLVQGGALLDDKHVITLTVRSRWADLHAPGVTAQIERAESLQLAA